MRPEQFLLKSREYWLKRAEQARAMSEQIHDTVATGAALAVAESCDILARYAPPEADLLSATDAGESQELFREIADVVPVLIWLSDSTSKSSKTNTSGAGSIGAGFAAVRPVTTGRPARTGAARNISSRLSSGPQRIAISGSGETAPPSASIRVGEPTGGTPVTRTKPPLCRAAAMRPAREWW